MRYSDRHLYKNAYYREQNPATASIKQISTDDPDIQAFLKFMARSKDGSQTGVSARASRTASDEEGEPVRRAPEQKVATGGLSVEALRNALGRLLQDEGLPLPSFRDDGDRWDVFRMTYRNLSEGAEATILLVDEKLRTLSRPSARQLYEALSQERSALDVAVSAVESRILSEVQSAPNQTMTWPELQKWAAAQRPQVATTTLMHFLTKLMRGEIPSWRGNISPPDLSQQKYAVNIPKGNHETHRLFSFTAKQVAPAPASQETDDTFAHLGASLPAALKSAGLELDPSSRMPTLTLKKGFIKLEIDNKNREVTISVRHGRSFKVAADTEIIVDAVLAEIARCFPKKIDLPAFVNRLKAAYSALLGSNKIAALPLDKVRRELRNPALPGDAFAAALAAVVREQPPEAEGMKLDHTRDIETGFLLPGLEDRGYFGGITFESARQAAPAPAAKEKTPAPASQEANYSSLMGELERQTYQDGVSIATAYLRGINAYTMLDDPEQSRANRAELAHLARSVDTQIVRGGVSGRKLIDKISILLDNMLEEIVDSNVNPFSARDGGLAMRKHVAQGVKAALGPGSKQTPPFDLANIISEIPVEGDTYLDRARLAAKSLATLLEGRGKTYAGRRLATLDLGNSDLTGLPAVLAEIAYNLGFASIYLFGQGRNEGEIYVERVSKVLNSLE